MKRMGSVGKFRSRQQLGRTSGGKEINFIWCFGKLLVEFLILQASFFTSQSLVTVVDFNEETDFRNARSVH